MDKYIFLEKARAKHGYRYIYHNLSDDVPSNSYVEIEYNDIIFKQLVRNHLSGKRPERNLEKVSKEDFIKKCIDVLGDLYDYDEMNFINMNSPIYVREKSTGLLFKTYPVEHLSKKKRIIKNEDYYIDYVSHLHNFRYTYEMVNYQGVGKKIKFKCSEHGDVLILGIDHLKHGRGCPKCKISMVKNEIRKFFKKYDINYYESKFMIGMRCKYDLSLNFYLPSFRVCVELISDDELKNEIVYNNYKTKEDYCEENMIGLIKIKYDQVENISDILMNSLEFHMKRIGII